MSLLLSLILAISSLLKSSNAINYITQRYWAIVQHNKSDDISCKHLPSYPMMIMVSLKQLDIFMSASLCEVRSSITAICNF